MYDPNSANLITLDPSYQDCGDPNGDGDPSDGLPRLTPLVPCKNNCKGGETIIFINFNNQLKANNPISVQYPVVADRTALLAAAALGATSFAGPAIVVGGVAAVGAGECLSESTGQSVVAGVGQLQTAAVSEVEKLSLHSFNII